MNRYLFEYANCCIGAAVFAVAIPCIIEAGIVTVNVYRGTKSFAKKIYSLKSKPYTHLSKEYISIIAQKN